MKRPIKFKFLQNIGMRSLKAKLLLFFMLISLVPLVCYTIISLDKSQNLLIEQFESQTQRQLDSNLSSVLNAKQKVMVELSHNPIITSMDYRQAEPYFKRFIKDNPEYSHLLICNDQGIEIAHSEGAEHHGTNIIDKEYFIKPWETEKPVIADATVSTSTGRKIVGIGIPLHIDGQKIGVLVGFIQLEYISDEVANKSVTNSGYTFILNKTGEYLCHPDSSRLLTQSITEGQNNSAFKQTVDKMISQQSDVENIKIDGQEMIINYKPLGINNWSIAMVSPLDEVLTVAHQLRQDTVYTMIVLIIVVLILGFALTNSLIKPINQLVRGVDIVSTGDLSASIKINSKDELGVLANSINKMIDNLKIMINLVKNNSDSLITHSQDLAASGQQASATVQEVASTSNGVAVLSSQSVEYAEDAARESQVVQQVAEESVKAIREITDKINAIANNNQKSSATVHELGLQSQQIGSIISTITNIAEQTNLLALNAAIEAARAGEHGKGFAVVAEEVRMLADQSASAANEIAKLIKEIKVVVQQTVTAMENGTAEVNEGVQIASKASSSIEQIIHAITLNTDMIEKIVDGAQQTDEGTQKLSAASEEIAATIQQVAMSSQELANISAELHKSVEIFKIE